MHRVFKFWGWKDSPKHVAVFLDLLLNAQWREVKYRHKTLLPGQLSTSYSAISKRTGVSIRSVRTVIKDLISTNEVTHQGLRDCSVITITNWHKYQMTDNVNDNQVTSNRQASDNLQERKKDKKERIYNNALSEILDDPDLVQWVKKITIPTAKKIVDEYPQAFLCDEVKNAYIWVSGSNKKVKNVASFLNNWFKRSNNPLKYSGKTDAGIDEKLALAVFEGGE